MSALAMERALEPDVRAASSGDRQAFVRLVDASGGMVCSIALAIVRDVQASEDVAQEVFLAAWAGLGRLRNPASFLPWLRQLTRNRAKTWLRDHVWGRKEAAEKDDLLALAADPGPDPAETLLEAEQRQVLATLIDELPDEAREVITLYYREGQSVRQVAELLGMREEAVRQRLSRARARLSEGLLTRLGTALERTAPSAAFSAGVAAALAASAPATAAAGVSTAVGLVGTGLMAKLGALLMGALPGAILGSLGVMFGVRRNLRRAMDDQERRELERFGRVSILVVSAGATSIGLAAVLESAVLMAIAGVAYCAACTWLCAIRMPRIIARRLEAERAADPGAARRHRRAKLLGYLWLGTGLVIGGGTLVWAVLELAGFL